MIFAAKSSLQPADCNLTVFPWAKWCNKFILHLSEVISIGLKFRRGCEQTVQRHCVFYLNFLWSWYCWGPERPCGHYRKISLVSDLGQIIHVAFIKCFRILNALEFTSCSSGSFGRWSFLTQEAGRTDVGPWSEHLQPTARTRKLGLTGCCWFLSSHKAFKPRTGPCTHFWILAQKFITAQSYC